MLATDDARDVARRIVVADCRRGVDGLGVHVLDLGDAVDQDTDGLAFEFDDDEEEEESLLFSSSLFFVSSSILLVG